MVTRTPSAKSAPTRSALVFRHVQDVYRDEPVPAGAIARTAREDDWFGVLPRISDLAPEGMTLVEDFRALKPELRGRLAAFALQGGTGILSAAGPITAATGFVEPATRGETRWTSDLHRLSVLAGAEADDHRFAGHLGSAGRPSPHGSALHLLFAGETADVADLVAAADFFARSDRPSWAVHCLVSAADSAPSARSAAALGAAAANIAACDGDFHIAAALLERYTETDTRVLIEESAPARALRQLLLDNDFAAAVETVRTRLRGDLDTHATGEALAVYAIVNVVAGEVTWWEGFVRECVSVSAPLHPEVAAVAAAVGFPSVRPKPHLNAPIASDARGWAQLAACAARVLHTYHDMRLGSLTPLADRPQRVGNALVRGIEALNVSLVLANNQRWDDLRAALEISLDTTAEALPIPHLRVAAEAVSAYADAFHGERETAQRRVDRVLGEPILRRAHRVRSMLDSVMVMIEGPSGNYEHAMALLSTRHADAADLTFGPCGPVELFDFVDYALAVGEEQQAVEWMAYHRDPMQQMHSQRANFVLAACDAILAGRTTLQPMEELLARAESLPFAYETARLRLVYAERLRKSRRPAEAQRHLRRAELELRSAQAGAWMERVQRELRACRREAAVALGALTEQEARIAELAAEGLSNKEIGLRLHLSPRTVGGHLYRIFPKLGVTTRAQLRDALSRSDLP